MDNPMIPCELCGQEISFNDYISHVNVCQHRRSILNLLNPMLNSFLFQRQMGTIVNLGSNIDFNFDNSNIQIVNIENMLDSYEVNNMISEMIGYVNHGVNNLEDAITNVTTDSILNSNDIDKDIKCSICLDDLCEEIQESNDKKIVKTTCNHYFHRSCITTWLREHRNCPLCQKDFNE
jgi:hypothetical protein